jgi:hypothetical protein
MIKESNDAAMSRVGEKVEENVWVSRTPRQRLKNQVLIGR